ncbi:hypothetical protein R69608_07033 [Paraburkholderia nemoris]|uniref:hypothetical protein n=1 Tax=Paraburkholderia nemoris TaxID=2793076 RepID=UPI001911F8C4|nr:hypothetical protein [Paraburkholderia nemoris]MBK5152456.1 hypothetical protein [Burkholderia sp. R-69608]CAE6967676.1 hypothetical protein R69608_07033 [Paraburkholderia nemoris]
MQQADLSKLGDQTTGLPDYWYIDDEGQPSWSHLMSKLRLPRKARNDRKLFDAHMSRRMRAVGFTVVSSHYRQLETDILLEGDARASWEAHVLSKFDAGWHLRGHQDLLRVQGLPEDVANHFIAEYKRVTKSEIPKTPSEMKRRSDLEILGRSALESYLKGVEELGEWAKQLPEQQRELADVMFAGFTLFGKRALEDAVAVEPSILEFYGTVLGSRSVTRSKFEEDAHGTAGGTVSEEVDRAPESDGDAVTATSDIPEYGRTPESLGELYTRIGEMAIGAVTSSDGESARQIRALIDTHLERLLSLAEQVSQEEADRLVSDYCRAFVELLDPAHLSESEFTPLVTGLARLWRGAAITALELEMPESWYATALKKREHQLPEQVGTFDATRAEIATLTALVSELEIELKAAKLTARPALKSRINQTRADRDEKSSELERIFVEAVASLLPADKTLEDAEEASQDDCVVPLVTDRISVRALRALDEFVRTRSTVVAESDLPDPTIEQSPDASLEVKATSEHSTNAELIPAGDVDVTADQPPEVVTAEDPDGNPVPLDETQPAVFPSLDHQAAPPPDMHAIGETTVESVEDRSTRTATVYDAIKHLDFTGSSTNALKAYVVAAEQYSEVPAILAEAIALHWSEMGHLNVAAQVLRDAGECTLVDGAVIDSSLFRLAYFGMNVWPKDQETLGQMQREFNLVNSREIDEQLERKPSGKIVPYLLAAATFQTALFAGNETLAPTLLKQIIGHFDGPLGQLFESTVEFTTRGGRVDWELLRNVSVEEAGRASEQVRNELNAWVDRNEQRTNLWHTLRLALKRCIEEPTIAAAIAAIRKGDKGNAEDVRAFARSFDVPLASRDLLDRLAASVRADYTHQEQIDSSAYRIFERQIEELVVIARAWLIEVTPPDVRSRDVGLFLERWRTQLTHSIAMLADAEQQVDLEHRAGRALLFNVLNRLLAAIQGETRLQWRYGQTEATFSVPRELLDLEEVGSSPKLRIEHFAARFPATHWLVDMTELAAARKAYRLQMLLLSERSSMGEQLEQDLKEVRREIDGALLAVRQSIERLRTLSGQAFMADVIDEARHQYFLASADANAEELAALPTFGSATPISDRVESLCASLETVMAAQASKLETELSSSLTAIRIKLGPDAVPEVWETRMRNALSDFSLTVVRELLDQLQNHVDRGEAVRDVPLDENADLQGFLAVEKILADVLRTVANPREAGAKVIEEMPGGLQYNLRQHDFKAAMEALVEQRKTGAAKLRKPTLDLQTYNSISKVLQFIGFPIAKSANSGQWERYEFSNQGEFRRLTLEVDRPAMPKAFPLFDNRDYVSLNLIYLVGEWSFSGFRSAIEQDGAPSFALLFVGTPLDGTDRNALAAFCKERKCAVFLLDPVVLSYLATVSEHRILETFLRVAAPWTYYMPYHAGDTRLPAPPEMRFGREGDAVELASTRGPALVYGGRQLGKTTLLHSAAKEFENLSPNHVAFFIRMDGGLELAEHREGGDITERVFALILERLIQRGVMTRNPHKTSAQQQISDEFSRPGKFSVLVCLDEIDPILNTDANRDFPLFRSLAGLVNDTVHRFKVVIAGLQNVNRFQSLPNVPLEQLGRPLHVTIMRAVDARRLIQFPLAALGYRFANPTLVDRVMAFTNRHPGLLHIYCAELIRLLSSRRAVSVGSVEINDIDLDSVESDSSVQKLCRDRFDMTLHLDKRYMLIVYGLIEKHGRSISSFSVKQALDVARLWAPDQFQGMSESGFEALLEELGGLGVLKTVQASPRQYALRNQSILQLVGSPGDVEHKLLLAASDVENDISDSLTCHPTTSTAFISPLSLADEKMVLQARPATGAPRYSVGVIMGSAALGVEIDSMRGAFSAMNEFESGRALGKYDVRVMIRPETSGLSVFDDYLSDAIARSDSTPIVVLVPIVIGKSISVLTDLLDVALTKASAATRVKHRVRVIFLLEPRAMWLWLSNPSHTAIPSDLGGIIQLQRWTRHACQGLLDQQGMMFTHSEGTQLLEATEGWYAPIIRFVEVLAEVRKKKRGASSLGELKDFRKLDEISSKDFALFVQQTGISSVPWSMTLAKMLHEYDLHRGFRVMDVRSLIESGDFGTVLDVSMAATVVEWWLALRVIDPVDTRSRVSSLAEVKYKFTAALQKAIEMAPAELST